MQYFGPVSRHRLSKIQIFTKNLIYNPIILNEEDEQRELFPRGFTSPPRTLNLINNGS